MFERGAGIAPGPIAELAIVRAGAAVTSEVGMEMGAD